MGNRKALRAIILILVTITAACVDGSETPTSSADSTADQAPVATADAATGAVTGSVTDDERRPIPGVTVSLIEPNLESTTDPAGQFTFNEVNPGSYRLIVVRLGYESNARKVEVRAGEVSRVEIQMTPITIANESYVFMVPRTTIIHIGPAFLYSWFVAAANQSNLNGLFCEPCWHIVHFPKSPGFGLTEADWAGGGDPCPDVNCEVWIFYKSSWTNAHSLTDGELAFSGNFNHRESIGWAKSNTDLLKGKEKAMLVASNGVIYPNIELKVVTYTSFSYNADFPDSYTALPPK